MFRDFGSLGVRLWILGVWVPLLREVWVSARLWERVDWGLR